MYGACWYAGTTGQSCNQVCNAHVGQVCVQPPDWSQVPEDCVLHAAVGFDCDSCGYGISNPYAPYQTGSICYARSHSAGDYSCSASSIVLKRICACETTTTTTTTTSTTSTTTTSTTTTTTIPSWYFSNWDYRKPINISNTAGDLTNYQVRIVHNFSAEYSAGKINTTCKDIRFTYYNASADTETEIPFWIEACNLSSDDNMTAWVNATYLENNTNTTIYMYYGNSSASSASDGDATFEFFDDFDDGTKFTEVSQPYGDPHVCGFPNYVEFYNANGEEYMKAVCFDHGELRVSPNLPSSDYFIRLKWRSGSDAFGGVNCAYTLLDNQYGASCNIPNRVIVINSNSVYEKGGKLTNYQEMKELTFEGAINSLYLAFTTSSGSSAYYTYYNEILVRKYASPEPSVSFGEEESS